MITNESEVRIALQAVLVSVLALYGFWGCALVVIFILLPWKPILAVGGYLAQPLVDWRVKKAHDRHEKGIAQIEQELDALLRKSSGAPSAPAPAAGAKVAAPERSPHPPSSRALESFKANAPAQPTFRNLTAPDLAATLAIPPVIKDHVRSLPQGVFHNMDLEVEEVKFNGDMAEAFVRFQSPNVTELFIRQRYVLRKSGDHWQVEARQPANGGGKATMPPPRIGRPTMRV
jgi:hypothetical protein